MRRILVIATIVGMIMGLLALPTTGIAEEGIRQAEITMIEGTAALKKAGQDEWVEAAIGDVMGQGDVLRTDPFSSAELNVDGSDQTAVVTVSENAELAISVLEVDASGAKNTMLDLAIGSVLIKASELEGDSKFEVNTPTSIVGVRGTTFEVRVSAATEE